MTINTKALLAAACAFGLSAAAQADTQGVTDTEVIIGAANDLSGIFAAIGVPSVQGAQLRIDEANAAGGVHGRQIRYIVEDHAYQLPRASQALNKLVYRDQIFAALMTLGTPHNLAGFQIMDPKGIFSVAPLSAAREILTEPLDTKYLNTPSYYDQVQRGLDYLSTQTSGTNICSMYLPTDFGMEIAVSTREWAEAHGATYAAETTHKPDEQDFVGALQKLKAEECDIVTAAIGVRAMITVVGTAKQLGWDDVTFLATSAGFVDAVAQVPGGVTDGLYAASGFPSLLSRAEDEVPAAFIAAYQERYGEMPSGFSMMGYSGADLLVRALEAAGPDLNQETFQAAIESLSYEDELMDMPIHFTPENHRGVDEVVVSVVEDGRWNEVTRLSNN